MSHRQKLKVRQAGAAALGSGYQKPADSDDPLQMHAEPVSGDQGVMLECLIEEFARMGWNAQQIAQLFEDPFFLASHSLANRLGRNAVNECIERTLRRCGVLRCSISESNKTQRT